MITQGEPAHGRDHDYVVRQFKITTVLRCHPEPESVIGFAVRAIPNESIGSIHEGFRREQRDFSLKELAVTEADGP